MGVRLFYNCACPECHKLFAIRVIFSPWNPAEFISPCAFCDKLWYWRPPKRWVLSSHLWKPWGKVYSIENRRFRGAYYVWGCWSSDTDRFMVFDCETKDSWFKSVAFWNRSKAHSWTRMLTTSL